MARADQGIKGRAAPKTKSRSSVAATIKARAIAPPAAPAPPPQHVTKAAKRAIKRSELMTQVRGSATNGSTSLPSTGLSKSGLRRMKRKQKEQLAGNTSGMKDLQEAMDEAVEGDEEMQSEEDVDVQYDTEPGYVPQTTNLIGQHTAKKNGAVTEKARKKALTTEMQRQNLILSDPAYAKSPFAALRLHAQNTLIFDKGSTRKKATS